MKTPFLVLLSFFGCALIPEPILETQAISQSTTSNLLVEVCKHPRGHVASFTEVSDGARISAELYVSGANLAATAFDASYALWKKETYQFGKVDFGNYTVANSTTNNYTTVNTAITQVRDGNEPTVMSYKDGNTSQSAFFLDKLLFGRNSNAEQNGFYDYNYAPGLTNTQTISKAATIRMEYYMENTRVDFFSGSYATGKTKVAQAVTDVVNSNGWYVDFMHWAWFEKYYSENYLNYLDSLLTNHDVYRGTYNAVAEYYYLRESVDSVNANGNNVTIHYSKKNTVSPYNKIKTELWVNLNTVGTSLEGKEIFVQGSKVRKLGTDLYAVSVGLDYTNTSKSFTVDETITTNYINLNKPIVSYNPTTKTITSDQPIRITVFSKLKTATDWNAALHVQRRLTLSTSQTISVTLTPTTKDYAIAYVNSEGISEVIYLQ